MSITIDDFDVEAAFEAELAKLNLEGPVDLGVLQADSSGSASDLGKAISRFTCA
jgi:hypothetical protein